MDRDSQFVTPKNTSSTRRRFFGILTVALGSVPVLGGLFLAVRTGLSPAKDNRPHRFRLCKKSEIPAIGSTDIKEFVISYQSRQGPRVQTFAKVVFLTRDPASGEVLAMSGECSHLGCPVQKRDLSVESGKAAPLVCPCHQGKFTQTGEVVSGAPKKPLRRLKMEALPESSTDDVYLLEI